MPRRVSRRRLVFAAVLIVLAIPPNIVHIQAAMYQPHSHVPERPVVRVLDRDWFHVNAASRDEAMAAWTWWERYRRCWWILAAIAACIVVRKLPPIPRIFGRDDD